MLWWEWEVDRDYGGGGGVYKEGTLVGRGLHKAWGNVYPWVFKQIRIENHTTPIIILYAGPRKI